MIRNSCSGTLSPRTSSTDLGKDRRIVGMRPRDQRTPVLEIENLRVTYGGERGGAGGVGRSVAILRDIDMRLHPGEVVAVVGESGSGKTTLGMAILGLLPQESAPVVEGSIRLAGTEMVGA